MKKNKLIEILQGLKGNPDIYLWNGLVDDFVDLDKEFVPMALYKRSRENLMDNLKFEEYQKTQSFIISDDRLADFEVQVDKYHRKQEWEEPNRFYSEEQMKRYYDRKKHVFVINAKSKGKSYHDRIGKISY